MNVPMELTLWVVHPDPEPCQALAGRFAGLPRFLVRQQRFEELEPHDCFVTAGNAYGIMSAGIDAAVAGALGPRIVERVQQVILDRYLGEQPVGTAFIVPTGNERVRYLCHAPTMRTPAGIDQTDAVYRAAWAALLAVWNFDPGGDEPIRTVAMPAMGTGFGRVPFDEAARQMAAAWRHFLNPPHRSLDWDWVIERERAICYDGERKVVR